MYNFFGTKPRNNNKIIEPEQKDGKIPHQYIYNILIFNLLYKYIQDLKYQNQSKLTRK